MIALPWQPDIRKNVVFTKRFWLLLTKYAFAPNARPNTDAVQPMELIRVTGRRGEAAKNESRY